MPSILKSLRLAADPNRLRLLLLLEQEELSVAELQEILAKGQSQISTHLAQLKQAGLVGDRRTGKNAFYRLKAPAELMDLLRRASREISETERDREALQLVLRKRRDTMRRYFDELAGKFGRHYAPGRSWKGLAEALLKLLPPMVIADLGAGEGTFSQLMAQRAKKVIAIDNSEKMVEFGSALAKKHGIRNLEYRLGDLEDVPIKNTSVDLAFFSQALHHAQHPERAIAEAWRILKPGGRIAILDLNRHRFEEAREMYADLWLGFTELEIERYLKGAEFRRVETAVVYRQQEPPYFETVLAVGEKAGARSPLNGHRPE
jgi:ubiquinone/menaquinone biosynthesis C-methylase UbiE/biotin operon repressor